MRWPLLRSRRRRERGVSAPEYALIAGILIFSLTLVVQFLTSSAGDRLQATGDQVASGDPAPTTTTTAGAGGASTTSTVPTTTATTAAPTTTTTTTAPTTTTTAPTTTTTAPTTTTTAPKVAAATFTGSGTVVSATVWAATGTVSVRNNLNQPISGATVTLEARVCYGTTTANCVWQAWQPGGTLTTASTGLASSSTQLNRSQIARIEARVVTVTVPAGQGTWNGVKPTVTINEP